MGLGSENKDLVGQIREGQEKLRISDTHIQRLVVEIDEFRRKSVDFDRNKADLERRLL